MTVSQSLQIPLFRARAVTFGHCRDSVPQPRLWADYLQNHPVKCHVMVAFDGMDQKQNSL